MTRQLALGVIGHVDHGKTSLVRALTGTDTDRLKEEKQRDVSIVIGFAHLAFANGIVDLIDMPGHEDYIRAMIAGAAGIGAALLVVDAREGVRRQTVEHIAIAEWLGVRRGVVALSKSDLLSDEENALAEQVLRDDLAGTFLGEAPVLRVSSHTGAGVAALREAIGELLGRSEPIAPAPGACLSVDRSFVMPGHGTVVTGTLRRGRLARGAEVEILPVRKRVLVRRLQVHARDAESALPGERVGLNLRGIPVDQVPRGSVVATPGLVEPSSRMDVELALARGFRPRHGVRVRMLVGTAEAFVRLRFSSSAPQFAQLLADRPLCALHGERFVLRDDGARATIGGGRVLAPNARRASVGSAGWRRRMERLAAGSPEDLQREEASARLREAQSTLAAFVASFHQQRSHAEGPSVRACREALPAAWRGAIFERALAELCAARRLERNGDCVRQPGFDALGSLSRAERDCADGIERAFRAGGLTPPDESEVVHGDPRREAVYRLLVSRRRLCRITSSRSRPVVFHREALEHACSKLSRAFPPPAQFTVSEAREVLGSSRKYVVPLLEHLDAARFTRRLGDLRVLRASDADRYGGE